MDETITPPKLAEYLSVTTDTVKGFMKSGILPYVQLPGGHYFIWKKDAIEFVERHLRGAISPILKALGESVCQ